MLEVAAGAIHYLAFFRGKRSQRIESTLHAAQGRGGGGRMADRPSKRQRSLSHRENHEASLPEKVAGDSRDASLYVLYHSYWFMLSSVAPLSPDFLFLFFFSRRIQIQMQ